jgi:uncharacterized membrane protein YkvA (DUF1232 family)
MLALIFLGVGVFGGRKFWKSHPALVQRYEAFAQTHFRLRTIIGARIATYIVVPQDLRPLILGVITIVGYITVWRWIKRKVANRKQRKTPTQRT